MVKFSFANMKLNALARFLGLKKKEVVSFDLPAGYSCPKAGICKTYVNRRTGKMRQVGRVKCYAAKAECYAPSVRRFRWANYIALLACKSAQEMAALIISAMPKGVKIIRIHSSGDFFSRAYFEAWLIIARSYPSVNFYGYTKVMEYAIADKPDNFRLQYSYGGLDDGLWKDTIPTCFIGEHEGQYPYRTVCGSHDTAQEDYIAIGNRESFVIGKH